MDLQLIAVILAAIFFGVLCTVLAQWAFAVRNLTAELSHTSREIAELVDTLKPTVKRVDSLTKMGEESEPDLRRMQVALHQFSGTSVEMSDNLARVSGWLSVIIPVVLSALERRASHAGEEADAEQEPQGNGAERPPGA